MILGNDYLYKSANIISIRVFIRTILNLRTIKQDNHVGIFTDSTTIS